MVGPGSWLANPDPSTVTSVASSAQPLSGITAVTSGSGLYAQPSARVAVPPAVVRPTSAAPGVPAGVTQVSSVAEVTTTLVAGTPPIETVVSPGSASK